jgi:hypothetical protein
MVVLNQSAGGWNSSIVHLVDVIDVSVDEVLAAWRVLFINRGQLLRYFLSQRLPAEFLFAKPRVSTSLRC